MCEVVAAALPDAGRAMRDRFALALTCNDLWAFLVDNEMGAARQSVYIRGASFADAVVAAATHHARAVQSLTVRFEAGYIPDATIRPLLSAASNMRTIRSLRVGDLNELAGMVNRLDALHLPYLRDASFLRGATLSRISFSEIFPPNLPVLPLVVWLGLYGYDMGGCRVFTGDAHAEHSTRALPRLATLVGHHIKNDIDEYFDPFLRLFSLLKHV